ncbi:hypothetical protein J2Z18_001069 [Paenibacillus lactis]|uniref:Uncharacterized protein n=1 Tax=Paenibacillus lactis TaxID=228574 RepID=A0ABS4F6X8_9BACL|nr:hypothetical protein [Paenibacillus lactis]
MFIESLGLEISALAGDLGGHGFQDRERIQLKSRNRSVFLT